MSAAAVSRVAAIQMNSRPDREQNLAAARRLLEAAAGAGAVLAALPENFSFMGAHERDKLAIAEPAGSGPIQDFLAAEAARLKLWIVAGTVPIVAEDEPGKVFAACLVHSADGRLAARYDKIHLFDVEVPPDPVARAGAAAERYRESATIARGALTPVVVDTPVGRLGLTVCYDLRFPELYRALQARGAEILCVPAAFTARTGVAHWHTLLRARAIENQCYVMAPGQYGVHAGGRSTFGHSLVLDPWGETLAEKDDGEGLATAEVSPERLRQVRTTFPALDHRRLDLSASGST